VLKGGTPLAHIEKAEQSDNQVRVSFSSFIPITIASLEYTNDGTNWIDRSWASLPATVQGNHVTATLPTSRPITYFMNLTDIRGAVVSTEHHERWR